MSELIDVGDEVEEYLLTKKNKTQSVYRSAFRRFLEYYKSTYGENKTMSHFLDTIYAELQKPRREQGRPAEVEISKFIPHNKDMILKHLTSCD